MAKLYYEPKNGGLELQSWSDPQIVQKSDIEDELAAFVTFRSLADEARTLLASGGVSGAGIQGGWPDLASFDDYLDDEIDRLRDTLDYFDYDSRVENLTVRDGNWFLPETVEDPAPDDNGTDLVGFAIDQDAGDPDPNVGDYTTRWQSEVNGTRVLTMRVRDYNKRISGIRLRCPNGTDGRSQLQGVTIRGAQSVANLDDAENIIEADVDFVYPGSGSWIEHTFPAIKKAKYIRLEIPSSLHSNADHIRMRGVQLRVVITNHDK